MLSAVAARKAAQAAKLDAQSQTPQAVFLNTQIAADDSGSDSERLETVLQTHKTKRKPPASSDVQTGRKKRRTKAHKTEALQTRYYESKTDNVARDTFNNSKGESDDFTSSESDSDEGEVRIIGDDGEAEDDGLARRPHDTKRAWSPSQPPLDSSDEELELGPNSSSFSAEEGVAAISSYPPKQQDAGYQHIHTFSFSPQPHKNIFYVEDSDPDILVGRCGTLVALQESETLALLGVYNLTILRGSVSLMGSNLPASSSVIHSIFAPKCSPIPIIEALAFNDPASSALSTVTNIPERISRVIGPDCTIIFIEDNLTGIDGLGRVCKTFEGVFEGEVSGENVFRLRSARNVSALNRTMQPFQLPISWQNAFASLPKTPSEGGIRDETLSPQPVVVLVRGQKRTGKSTLARTVMNRLLNQHRRIAFLECDLGQTEFTPPALVSLNVVDRPMFGPPFTHPLLPYASHFIGSTSPRNSPSHYVSSIQSLIQTYKIDLQYPAPEDEVADADDFRTDDVIPLVVNTMGWTKGLGTDFAKQIEEAVEPTHIFSMQNMSGDFGAMMDVAKSPLRAMGGSGSGPQVIEVEPIPSGIQSARYTAADWRTISLMSYFHSIPSPAQYYLLPTAIQPSVSDASFTTNPAPLCTWDCRLPLIAHTPYSVSPSTALDSVVLVGAGSEDVVPSEVGRVLNGALVALVSCQPGSVDVSPSQIGDRLPYSQGADPPDPATSNCIGLALVRGVSPSVISDPKAGTGTEKDVLHVLTPLPPTLIASSAARFLVKGEVELPIWGMLDYRELERDGARSHEIDGVPYLQWSKSEAVGAERRRVRRNLMRRGQM